MDVRVSGLKTVGEKMWGANIPRTMRPSMTIAIQPAGS